MDTKEKTERGAARGRDSGRQALLSRKIRDLSLRIAGTRLEVLITQLYAELASAGISFKPKSYLADEWGCPQGVPVIGIPFYLADPELSRLEGDVTGIEAEDEAEVMMYLRHEAGHAFNYAYHLYATPAWDRLFGPYSRPYAESYRPVPFSPHFVRHVPGWYAQKHPDEDFAETFAVWLTPGSNWRERYADTPALAKLLYVDGVVREYGSQPPAVTDGTLDTPVEELGMTLDEWYKTSDGATHERCVLPIVLNEDLRSLFPAAEGQPAMDVLRADGGRRIRLLIREVNRWTGLNRHLLGTLISELLERIQSLGLNIEPDQLAWRLTSLAVFVTTLAMNYTYTDQFISQDIAPAERGNPNG